MNSPLFTIEMLEFKGDRPMPRGRLAEPLSILEDAKFRGKREASSCVVEQRRRPGFRLDVTGHEVFCWRRWGNCV